MGGGAGSSKEALGPADPRGPRQPAHLRPPWAPPGSAGPSLLPCAAGPSAPDPARTPRALLLHGTCFWDQAWPLPVSLAALTACPAVGSSGGRGLVHGAPWGRRWAWSSSPAFLKLLPPSCPPLWSVLVTGKGARLGLHPPPRGSCGETDLVGHALHPSPCAALPPPQGLGGLSLRRGPCSARPSGSVEVGCPPAPLVRLLVVASSPSPGLSPPAGFPAGMAWVGRSRRQDRGSAGGWG